MNIHRVQIYLITSVEDESKYMIFIVIFGHVFLRFISDILGVVATTRPVSNSSTNNKSQRWISSEKHELCNSQENSTGNYNSILLTIYISVLGSCYNFSMPTLMSMSYPHIHYSSTSYFITHSLCVYLKASMPYTYALMSYPKPYSSSPSCMHCYNLRTLEWVQRLNSCIREDIRKLNRELFINQFTLYTPTDGPYQLLCILP